MTAPLDLPADALIDAVRAIEDPVARYEAAKEIETLIIQAVREVKAEAAKELYEGRTWGEVGRLLRVTGSRAEQISRAAR